MSYCLPAPLCIRFREKGKGKVALDVWQPYIMLFTRAVMYTLCLTVKSIMRFLFYYFGRISTLGTILYYVGKRAMKREVDASFFAKFRNVTLFFFWWWSAKRFILELVSEHDQKGNYVAWNTKKGDGGRHRIGIPSQVLAWPLKSRLAR